jgi:hypothetical protein
MNRETQGAQTMTVKPWTITLPKRNRTVNRFVP